jgi:hypothetical protein
MSSAGKSAAAGGVCGYFLVTLLLVIFTDGTLSGLIGLMFGLPIGMVAGIITALARSPDRTKTSNLIWIVIAVILVLYLAAWAVVMFINARNQ